MKSFVSLACLAFLLVTSASCARSGAESASNSGRGSGDSQGATDDPAATSAGTTDATQPKKSDGKRPRVAYVTNGIASFWVIAEAGAHAAANEFDVDLEVRMPPSDGRIANQIRMLEELLTMGVSGIAVSPIKPEDQLGVLNEVGKQCNFITHDADAPDSNRLAYVGMNNYDAGRVCGKLVKEALPDGGEIMIFVGSLDQLNARLRRQGVIDELLDRTHDPKRYDQPDVGILKGTKYTILDTRTDDFDFAKGKAQAEEAIAKYPDLDGMVGLFAYNPPLMLEALKGADKVGKIKLIAFDEDDATLQAIIDGHCIGTVVQDPYRYGYESVRILAGLARDDKSVLPPNGFLEIKERVIRKDNVREFWDELKKRVKEGEAAAKAAR